MLNNFIRFFLENKVVTFLFLGVFIAWGVAVAPFNWESDWFPRDPVAVDAIPDLGENQQIVFTEWQGRSPEDMEDQVTYPLTTALLGVPGVKTIRSSSMFGFSSIYIIFEEDIEFYWSRSRILEKINSLPQGTLPEGVQPMLGPDATALGQIFWYTLEARDENGEPVSGWDPQELRTIQDFTVKYALSSASGVSEVASIGGYVKEYQIDVSPTAMKEHDISLEKVVSSIKNSNVDVGAKTLEINKVEYFIRGLGYVKSISDLEETVVKTTGHTPIRIKDIAKVKTGPAPRRGVLDKAGAEAVGGVVVARHGANPLQVIKNVKKKIEQISSGLPSKKLADGTVSKVTVVPFYDRTELIKETLGTLEEALSLEILITIIVVLLMVMNMRTSIMISSLLPIAVLMCFIAMRYFRVDANIVALSGIAIAIGTMVDMAIILSENILKHLEKTTGNLMESIYKATTEVASAILTAVATTIVSFLPVFTMVAAEGKLFRPLAFTKTFALIASIIVTIIFLPALAHVLFSIKIKGKKIKSALNILAFISGIVISFFHGIIGLLLIGVAIAGLKKDIIKLLPEKFKPAANNLDIGIFALIFSWFLAGEWLPLGPENSLLVNFIFTTLCIGVLISLFYFIIWQYERILTWCINNKLLFLSIPTFLVFWGLLSWLGFKDVFRLDKEQIENNSFFTSVQNQFPGIGEEFMPSLDEGSFLLMPTSMPHSGIEENKELLSRMDMAVNAIPEVDMVVGKLGRVESALDPAPISMFENVINYKSEYKTDENGKRQRFAVNEEGEYKRDSVGKLIPDPSGKFFRQWRDHIQSPDDIWEEIVKVTKFPGLTSAPKLQPIETRLIMLQTGMRAPMGVKVKGPSLASIEKFGMKLENLLKQVDGVKDEAVFADRIVGKPYLQIHWDRKKLGRYGLSIKKVQHYLETAVGGMKLTTSVEGRERYPIRVRYPRELRDDPESLKNILIPIDGQTQVPLEQLATIKYKQGPQNIKSEDTFLVGYVLFDKMDGYAEVEVVEAAQDYLDKLVGEKKLNIPAGINYEFTGNYENQVRAEKRLSIVLPLSLLIIFFILYLQFRSWMTTSLIFTGIFVAFSGGFIMLWLFGQDWFMNFPIFGENMREFLQMGEINLSVAVWVGFIALFGIATDDGVIIATYLKQRFDKDKPGNVQSVRSAVIKAGKRRVRPCLMTTATTILALLPILSSTGRGSDILIPMAIPAFGGMSIELITLFVIPVLYSAWQERKVKRLQIAKNK